jgi:hypothetical protein
MSWAEVIVRYIVGIGVGILAGMSGNVALLIAAFFIFLTAVAGISPIKSLLAKYTDLYQESDWKFSNGIVTNQDIERGLKK